MINKETREALYYEDPEKVSFTLFGMKARKKNPIIWEDCLQ